MRTALLSALLSVTAACDITTGANGRFDATWSFVSVAGAQLDCPAGYGLVDLELAGPVIETHTFDCTARETGTIELPYGAYSAKLRVHDQAGHLYGTSRELGFDLDDSLAGDHATLDEVFLHDGGRFEISMTFLGFLGNQIGCAEAGIASVRLRATAGGMTEEQTLPCGQVAKPSIGLSRPFLAMPYQAELELLDDAGRVVTTTGRTNVVMFAPNGYVLMTDIVVRL